MYIAAGSICPLYEAPEDGSPRADEVLYGWPLTGLEERGPWLRVRTHYGYEGWVRRALLVPGPAEAGERLMVTAPFADVLEGPEVELPLLATLPRGGLAEPMPGPCPEGWRRVTLLDGREGYVKGGHTTPWLRNPPQLPEEALRARVVARAMSYLGTQYRWGGKSPAGIDCSGLTFMAWFFSGVCLYRDAKLVEGYPARPIPPEACKPADLLYFPGHIALCLGEGRYIHATARTGSDGVVINSLNPAHPDFRPDLAERLLTGGTVFPLGR